MHQKLLGKTMVAALGLSVLVALVFGFVVLNRGDETQAQQLQFHGVIIQKSCESPSKAGDTTDCLVRLIHNDGFGDSISIREAFDRVDPLGDNVRVPATGDLPISAVSGNTTCTVGGSLPCSIGPAGSTLGGLPGTGALGQVTFRSNEYVIQGDDPDPLPDQGTAVVKDLCDAPGTSGCSTLDNTVQFNASTDLVHPDIDVTKTAASPSKAGDSVDYTIKVCNTGDQALEHITVSDSLLGDVSDSYADTLSSGACESHVFPRTVLGGDPDPLVNTVDVHADPLGPLTNDITDRASATVDLVHPDFTIVKECSPDPVAVGGTITWTVTLKNTGDVGLVIEVDDPVAGINETVTLAPGASQTITRSRTATDADVSPIANTVTATARLEAASGLPNVIEKNATTSCAMGTPTPTVTPSPTPSATPSPTPSATPSPTPSATPSPPTPSATPSPAPTTLPAERTPSPTAAVIATPVAPPSTGGGAFGPGARTTLWTILFLSGGILLFSIGIVGLRGRKRHAK